MTAATPAALKYYAPGIIRGSRVTGYLVPDRVPIDDRYTPGILEYSPAYTLKKFVNEGPPLSVPTLCVPARITRPMTRPPPLSPPRREFPITDFAMRVTGACGKVG